MVIMILHEADIGKSNSKNFDAESISIEIEVPDKWKEAYASDWERRRERIYIIHYQGRTHYITCFVLRDKKKEDVLFVPDFLVPSRPYPIYVYLYAISLYCENPGMSQRKVAEATRKEFGLEKFSHTTVGRALKAFVSKQETEEEEAGNTEGTGSGKHGGDAKSRSFPGRQITETRRRRAMAALPEGLSRMSRRELISTCCGMARKRHEGSMRYLL